MKTNNPGCSNSLLSWWSVVYLATSSSLSYRSPLLVIVIPHQMLRRTVYFTTDRPFLQSLKCHWSFKRRVFLWYSYTTWSSLWLPLKMIYFPTVFNSESYMAFPLPLLLAIFFKLFKFVDSWLQTHPSQ